MFFFFFNDTATTEIYTLSLHDALPIYAVLGYFETIYTELHAENIKVTMVCPGRIRTSVSQNALTSKGTAHGQMDEIGRAHVWTPVTLIYLVCRLLLEKKKKKTKQNNKKKKKKPPVPRWRLLCVPRPFV